MKIKFSQNSDEKETLIRPILFIGGMHGDEPEGVQLSEHLDSILEKEPFNTPYIHIPCLNQYGYTNNTRTNENGVDLNRNFPSKNWTQSLVKDRYYSGASPASEPQIKELIKIIEKHNPRCIIHFHSWEPCIIYSGEGADYYAEMLAAHSGYELKNNIGYPTPGSLSHYAWEEHEIPVICVEIKEKLSSEKITEIFDGALKSILKDPPGLNEIETIIFDLDDTLLETHDLLIPEVLKQTCSAFIKEGLNLDLETCQDMYKEYYKERSNVGFFTHLITNFSNPNQHEKLYELLNIYFYKKDYSHLISKNDRLNDELEYLSKKYQLFLVTQGDHDNQRTKINKMEISSYFQSTIITKPGEKKSGLTDLVLNHQLNSKNCLVVGDRIDNEIEIGNNMNMLTCWRINGEHKNQQITNTNQIPDLIIYNVSDLRKHL